MSLTLQSVLTPAGRSAAHEDSRRRLARRCVAFLRKVYPVTLADIPQTRLEAFAHIALDRIGPGKLRSERDVFSHLIAMMLLGPWFDQDPVHVELIRQRIARDGKMPRHGSHAVLNHADDWVVWTIADAPTGETFADRIADAAGAMRQTKDLAGALRACSPKRYDVLAHHGVLTPFLTWAEETLAPRVDGAPALLAATAATLQLGRTFDANPLISATREVLTLSDILAVLRALPSPYLSQKVER